MLTRTACHCLTAALGICSALNAASGQLTTNARRALEASPPGSVIVGRPVTLSVRGAPAGAAYRFVAVMTATGSAGRPVGRCSMRENIGTGVTVRWKPLSGSYRLTAYGPVGPADADTLRINYTALPENARLTLSQTPAQNGHVMLTLRARDFGVGHVYNWWLQYKGPLVAAAGGGPVAAPLSAPWTAQTSVATVTFPTPMLPPSEVHSRLSVHHKDACDVVATDTLAPLP